MLAASRGQSTHLEIDDVAQIPELLDELARQSTDVLAVNGGDGTVQAVMTALINQRPFETPPPIAVVPAGMTNLIAADVGLRGKPDVALQDFLSRVESGNLHRQERPVLTLAAGPDHPGIHGMFVGAGAFYDGVVWSREHIHSKGAERNLAVVLAIAGLAFHSLFGGTSSHPVLTGTSMRVRLDDAPFQEEEFLVLLATTLDRMLMGMMPFWDEDGATPETADGKIRVTTVAYPPRRLVRALLPILRGRLKPWMRTTGYRSRRAQRISLACDKPIVFDGEFFDATRFGLPQGAPLLLERRHSLSFIR
jgi:diacylglycerol kinase family enzyme